MQNTSQRQREIKREDAFLMVKLLEYINKHDYSPSDLPNVLVNSEGCTEPMTRIAEYFLKSMNIKIQQLGYAT